jgi:hypothetical protein
LYHKKKKRKEVKKVKIKINNKILNKNGTKNQFAESSGHFPLTSNPGAGWAFSVSLVPLKVGILSCVAMGVAPP